MLTQFPKILATVIIVMDPVGLVPIYLALTGSIPDAKRASVVRTAILASFLISSVFIVGGSFILKVLGIHPGAFYVSGGILLLLTSIDMLYGKPKRSSEPGESDESDPGNVAIFPLAIPMMAGPGTITTIMLFMSADGNVLVSAGMLFAAVAITLGMAALTMTASRWFLRAVGRKGVIVLERIMGLLLSALSIQFIYGGLIKLGIIGGQA